MTSETGIHAKGCAQANKRAGTLYSLRGINTVVFVRIFSIAPGSQELPANLMKKPFRNR